MEEMAEPEETAALAGDVAMILVVAQAVLAVLEVMAH